MNHFISQFQGPTSSEQPYHHEDVDYSHYQSFHSNQPHRELCLSRVQVNKFDGSDPTGWVTQMEHFFSLHGITDELAKLYYNVFYLDLER
jgi:hypothetical protein